MCWWDNHWHEQNCLLICTACLWFPQETDWRAVIGFAPSNPYLWIQGKWQQHSIMFTYWHIIIRLEFNSVRAAFQWLRNCWVGDLALIGHQLNPNHLILYHQQTPYCKCYETNDWFILHYTKCLLVNLKCSQILVSEVRNCPIQTDYYPPSMECFLFFHPRVQVWM